MSVFDTIAENRYQQWLEASQQPGYQAPQPHSKTRSRLSFEGMLYQEVLALLQRAARARAAADRKALMGQASKMELQLIVALEKRGLPRVADTLRETIDAHRGAVDV